MIEVTPQEFLTLINATDTQLIVSKEIFQQLQNSIGLAPKFVYDKLGKPKLSGGVELNLEIFYHQKGVTVEPNNP